MSRSSLLEEWAEVMRSKGWVTAFADTSRPELLVVPIDRIVVKSEGQERVIYQAQPGDLQVGRPIVSPDGTRLAFPKTEDTGHWLEKGIGEQKIYIMDIDGSNLKALIHLTPVFPIKGAHIAAQIAWSHDNRSLAFLGTLKGVWDKEPGTTPRRLGPTPPREGEERGPPRSLMRVDVMSANAVEVVKFGRTVFGDYRGPEITSQAWSPDNRRLVYANKEYRVIILDTITGSQLDLGPGRTPTWSPDGRFIAAQLPGEGKAIRQGDYILISTEPPYQRATLLSNARTLLTFRDLGYYGPALWFPDSRFLMVYYIPPEVGHPYLLDRTTGEIAKLPARFGGHSWGGGR